MSARHGIFDRLIGRGRAGHVVHDAPGTGTPSPEAMVARYVGEAQSAMRGGRFDAWLARPEPFSGAMIDPTLRVACLRVALDRLAAVHCRMAGPVGGGVTDPSASRGALRFGIPSGFRTPHRHAGVPSRTRVVEIVAPTSPRSSDDGMEAYLLWTLISRLLLRKPPYAPEDVVHLLDRVAEIVAACPARDFEHLLVRELLASVAGWAGEHGLGQDARAAAVRLREAVDGAADSARLTKADRTRIVASLVDLLDEGGPEGVLSDRDEWGRLVRESLARMTPDERAAWRPVLEQAATANGARPTGAWSKRADARIAAVGEDAFARAVVDWLESYVAPPRRAEDAEPPELDGTAERNVTVLRGLVWCCAGRGDARLARAVAGVTEASYRKLPGVGPRCLKLGNAGVHALGAMPGMHGVEQLARLRQRVVYAQARRAIEGALDGAAARLGLAREDLDDLATPTFDLVDGRRRFAFPPFAAELVAGGTAGVEVRWFGPGGVARRTEPAEVRRRYPEERAALRRTADDLRKTLTAQRDRLERLPLSERSWPLAVWRGRYLDHPLLADLSRRLIWTFGEGERATPGAWRDGTIVDAADRPIDGLTEETRVRLWHPIDADGEATAAWQDWLDRHTVRQPFKQAHREIYVLTDAERTTATYSNRFASHVLRQHQFRALAQGRGWTYRLQGGFDGENVPTLELPRWRLAVEFLVEAIEDDEAMSVTGFYPFVSTDQVRFRRFQGVRGFYGDVVPLTEIPPLVLTEVMRDVDLFVGVASVGTDPTWRDRGPQRVREYWDGFAFGELNASARTRRAVLGRLVPRLAIAERCELEERFLVVRGDLRTYRIHLGSGNIRMEPNNQYLCIVPKAGGHGADPGLFLPFEGDALLTTIISKALLLADDRAITDPTITRQIGR